LIRWVIISAFLFTIGNAIWKPIGGIEKVFWIPLGLFLWALVMYVHNDPRNKNTYVKIILLYFAVLASGNIIKQAFYQDGMLQINDYVWGIGATIILIIRLLWATRKQHSGRK
jgi:hypothetical protein